MEDKSETENEGIEKKVVGRQSRNCDSEQYMTQGEVMLIFEFKLGNMKPVWR